MIVTEQITIAGQNALHFYTTERKKNILATALVSITRRQPQCSSRTKKHTNTRRSICRKGKHNMKLSTFKMYGETILVHSGAKNAYEQHIADELNELSIQEAIKKITAKRGE